MVFDLVSVVSDLTGHAQGVGPNGWRAHIINRLPLFSPPHTYIYIHYLIITSKLGT